MKIHSTTLAICLIFTAYGSAYAEQTSDTTEAIKPIVDAETSPDSVVIEGDQLQIQMNRKFKSIGNAVLHQQKQDIYGDTIEYDIENKELHAIGNVRLITSGGSVTGPELRMQLEESTGRIDDAKFSMNKALALPSAKSSNLAIDQSASLVGATQQLSSPSNDQPLPSASKQQNGARGDARVILLEGEDKKRFKHSRYTTCDANSDDWYIKSSDLVIDNYTKTATARNAVVEFQGVPILYTPWIDFSFLNQRKSGLLTPTVGTTSKSGFEVLTPFYWNIAPNMDATLATRYLSRRGLQYQGELRYVTETYSGIDNIEYLDNDDTTGKARYYAKLKHTQNFGNGWSGGFSVEKVSDNQYFSDLSTRITATSVVNLPQQGSLSYVDDAWNFNALVQKYQTLDGVSFPYERLPQLTLTRNDDFGLLSSNVYSQWVSFNRNSSAPLTTLTPSGASISTAVTGNRFVAYPSISLPMAQPYGYITPKLGVRYSSYSLNNSAYSVTDASGVTTAGNYESTSQSIPTFTLDSGLFFDRNARVVNNSYTQTLEPRLFYVYIPYKDQSMLPVFDSSDSDLNMGSLFRENQFIGNDRINNANQLSLAVTTRMIDNKTGEQRLAASLGQRFYFDDQKVFIPGTPVRSGNSSDIVAALTAKLLSKWSVDAAWQFNTDTGKAVKSNIGTRYSPEPGKTLNLSYRYTENFLDQINVSGQWPLTPNWYGLARYNYSFKETQPIEGLAGLEYDAGCWVARGVFQRVSTATANANYAIFVQLELGGLTSIGSDPLSLLNRSIPGYTNSSLIPNSVQQPTY
ncbi:LPS-assembly protein LptD [Methyloradius palustris]|uniref:LPS-assembly protein LptD n=1 Tax=Methyloradius palustris TaxID=2778876 RepID=A0A8D5G4W0_9PROT|nr:LPS-assembly protein LptD [Methyloradius palustris]BCM25785.1 LPS-assembly protein LptD [Methyloradius palustris]